MNIDINDYWWFQKLDEVIWKFALIPEDIISRNSGGSVSEDCANDFDHFYKLILSKYGKVLDIEFITALHDIDQRLARVSDWSNSAFCNSNEWGYIRKLAFSCCFRTKKFA